MSITQTFGASAQQSWDHFVGQEHLTQLQADRFEQYLLLLDDWNKKTNLTRITNLEDVLNLHFKDSLQIRKFFDFSALHGVCDVGTGGGFPGIPLAIVFENIQITLLEVNNKKISFLQTVIDQLQLKNCQVVDLDWRTFLRQAPVSVDLFCARASLKPLELIRVFAGSSPYQKSTLVYWASKNWEPEGKEKLYLQRLERYQVGDHVRQFAFFAHQ